MKRIHIHVAVDNLDSSIRFYSAVLGSEPSVLKTDYAKWLLEDPRVNFAISTARDSSTVRAEGGHGAGLRHLGIQVESAEELNEVRGRFMAADPGSVDQTDTTCCYARSDKSWATDPSGIAWEAFHTHGAAAVNGDGSATPAGSRTACCDPSEKRGDERSGAEACCNPAEEPCASLDAAPSACCTPRF